MSRVNDVVPSDKMFNVTRDYFGLLFDIRRKERAVLKVNPLLDVEVNFPNPKGGFENRYLCFNFRRIVTDGLSESIVPFGVSDLQGSENGPFVIIVHESVENIGNYIACAEIPPA